MRLEGARGLFVEKNCHYNRGCRKAQLFTYFTYESSVLSFSVRPLSLCISRRHCMSISGYLVTGVIT